MTLFFPQKMVPDCKPEWNREARMVFSRLPSLMAADKPCPQLQPSLTKGGKKGIRDHIKRKHETSRVSCPECNRYSNILGQ